MVNTEELTATRSTENEELNGWIRFDEHDKNTYPERYEIVEAISTTHNGHQYHVYICLSSGGYFKHHGKQVNNVIFWRPIRNQLPKEVQDKLDKGETLVGGSKER